MTTTELPTRFSAPTVLTAGFRFYFLAAGGFAVVSIAAWLIWLGLHAAGGAVVSPTVSVAPQLWHAHEMVYGYTAAVMAGFFLTAVPNWTGTPPAGALYVGGTGLIWLAGRLAVWGSAFLDPVLVAVIDLAFVPLLAMRVAGSLFARPQARNLVFIGLLTLFFLGNLCMHFDWIGVRGGDAAAGVRLGLLVSAAMIAIIGGRIVPAFTRNALERAGYRGTMPITHPLADKVGILSALLLAVTIAAGAPSVVVGSIAGVAAVANGWRLAGWRGRATLKQPILWSLHLFFLALVAGYAALAGAHLFGAPTEIGALHVIGIGAAGGMTLAVMSRAALGHTGRPLRVPRPIALAYLAIALAAAIRGFGTEIAPDWYYTVIFSSGVLWLAGFACFSAIYLPILACSDTPRA